ncbi:protein FAM13A-like isoform X1 [Pseudophryne corroboree]|uniref:protein FAM13A-like isoform X1 n=2 Tax=Pseudophryne corroboree TaxID=495146 RepID=UPI003082007B
MGCICCKMFLPTPRQKPSKTARLKKVKKGVATDPGTVQPPIPSGKVFGVPLAELEKDGLMMDGVPAVVWSMVEYLRSEGISYEGIFRVNGNVRLVNELREKYDRSEPVTLPEQGNVPAAASLLKLFLREIPDGLISAAAVTQLMQCYQENEGDTPPERSWMEVINELPEAHYRLLNYICHFLAQVAAHSADNKMDANNLAIVFGPNCFRVAPDIDGVKQQAICNKIMAELLNEYTKTSNACEHTSMDKVCETKPEELLEEAEVQEPPHEIPQASLMVAESLPSPDCMDPDGDMPIVTSTDSPHREMNNEENAAFGCRRLEEADGMPKVDI